MFGLLKKKLDGFVDKLVKKEEKKEPLKEQEVRDISAPRHVELEKVEQGKTEKIESGHSDMQMIEPVDEREYEEQREAAEESGEEGSVVESKRPELADEKTEKTADAPREETKIDKDVVSPKHVELQRPQKTGEREEAAFEHKRLEEIKQVGVEEEKKVGEEKSSDAQLSTPKHVDIKQVEKTKTKSIEEDELRLESIDVKDESQAEDEKIEEGLKPKEEKRSSIFDVAKNFFSPKKEAVSVEPPKSLEKKIVEKKEELRPREAEELDHVDLEKLEKRALDTKTPEKKVKIGMKKSITGFLSPTITVSKEDVSDLLDELELELLESDVAIEVSSEVKERLEKKLVGLKVQKSKMQEEVQGAIKDVIISIMDSDKGFDLLQKVQEMKKPVKIMFVGPNGAGKTTTIAKMADLFKRNDMSVVISASDTFRAAAIEQAQVHAERLGVPIIKGEYGADPASVAYDAVKYANSHKTDVVLIDSAGRQDTNLNLLEELKKMDRVIKPDLKIYIGESIGGNALIEQIRGFHEKIGIDGAILTKLDCDAKGGTAISLTYSTGVPIIYLGIGQAYSDIEVFDAKNLADRILNGPTAA